MNFNWIKYHRRSLLNSAIIVITLGVLAGRFFLTDPDPTPHTDGLYESWIQGFHNTEEMLEALRHVELTTEQSAQIAQRLIGQGKGQQAEHFARIPIENLRIILPEYAEFAENGVRMAKGKFEEAFESALSLKEDLIDQGKKETLLYGFNLLRLTSLACELQKQEGLIRQELENFLVNGTESAQVLKKVIPEAFR